MSGNRWPWAIRCETASNQPPPSLPVLAGRHPCEQAIEPGDHRPGKKIGIDLDDLGRQQERLICRQLIDPGPRLANRDRNG
jgi:hypothetical protein